MQWNRFTPTLGMWNGKATLQNSLEVSLNAKRALNIWPSNCTLKHLFQRNKEFVHIEICTQMFIETLFIIDKNWKEPRCLTTGECVNKLMHPHHQPLLSIKRKELVIHATTRMNLQWTMMSEKNSSKRQHTVWFHSHKVLERTKSHQWRLD